MIMFMVFVMPPVISRNIRYLITWAFQGSRYLLLIVWGLQFCNKILPWALLRHSFMISTEQPDFFVLSVSILNGSFRLDKLLMCGHIVILKSAINVIKTMRKNQTCSTWISYYRNLKNHLAITPAKVSSAISEILINPVVEIHKKRFDAFHISKVMNGSFHSCSHFPCFHFTHFWW